MPLWKWQSLFSAVGLAKTGLCYPIAFAWPWWPASMPQRCACQMPRSRRNDEQSARELKACGSPAVRIIKEPWLLALSNAINQGRPGR